MVKALPVINESSINKNGASGYFVSKEEDKENDDKNR